MSMTMGLQTDIYPHKMEDAQFFIHKITSDLLFKHFSWTQQQQADWNARFTM